MNREKITYKKEIFYKERDENERTAFINELNQLPENIDVVYVDESGVQKEKNPIRGRAKRGVKGRILISKMEVEKLILRHYQNFQTTLM